MGKIINPINKLQVEQVFAARKERLCPRSSNNFFFISHFESLINDK